MEFLLENSPIFNSSFLSQVYVIDVYAEIPLHHSTVSVFDDGERKSKKCVFY